MPVRVRERELGLESRIVGFGDVLGGDRHFVMPYLQRPYEWGEAEVADMVGDLLSANNAGYRNYFLGHIVGVANDDTGVIEIVDGQQRFITVTILFAYLRDRVRSAELKDELQNCIMKADRVRVAPRPTDTAFLKEWVQTPGAIEKLITPWGRDEAPFKTETDAQALMVGAARTVHEKLERLAIEPLEKLAIFILDQAVVDFIRANDRSIAAVLYRGMNMRGKQLSTADLIKLEAIEGTGLAPDVKEVAARTWEASEDELGREDFTFLLETMPLIVSRKTTERPGDLAEWRRHTFSTVEPDALLLRLLPVYASVFRELMKGEIRATPKDRAEELALADANRLLKGLLFLQERHWVAPAISAVYQNRDRPLFLQQFFKGLDRLAFASFLDGIRHEDRAERFARVVRAGADETLLQAAFALKGQEAAGTLRRLGEPFKRHGWRRRAICVRINAAFSGGYAFHPVEDVTVEHVLPTSHSAAWQAAGWSNNAQAACANLIGNYLLTTAAQNNRASQKLFGEKLPIYFETRGCPVHPITEDIRRITDWNERVVRERTERLIRLLAADWDLD